MEQVGISRAIEAMSILSLSSALGRLMSQLRCGRIDGQVPVGVADSNLEQVRAKGE